MKRLENSIGEKVEIDFVTNKTLLSVLGEIKDVKRFRFVEVKNVGFLRPTNLNLVDLLSKDSMKIPFIWPGTAIQKIEAEEILYDNFWIKEYYNQLDPRKVLELAEILYGKEVAKTLIELKQTIEENDKSIFKIFYT